MLLITALTAMLALTPNVHSSEMTTHEKAESVMSNIAGIDITKYSSEVVSDLEVTDSTGVTKNTILYNLNSQESKLEVICNFRDNELVSININPIEGSPVLTRQVNNDLDSAKNILKEYTKNSKAMYIQPMLEMLNKINELTPSETVSDNLKMTIKTEEYTYIEWMNAPNGIHNTYNRIILIFQNGILKTFTDSWERYSIGIANAKISKEESINIAKHCAQNFSYKIGNTTVNNLTLLDKPELVQAQLTMQPRENELYPHWEVLLPLDQYYPGMTTSIRVTLWADTGNVISVNAKGSLGTPVSIDSTSTPEQSSIISNQSIGLELIIGSLASAVIIIIGIAILKKKRK